MLKYLIFNGWVMKLVIILSFIFIFFPAQAAEAIKSPHVSVSWVAPEKISALGSDIIGLKFTIDPQWHIYWKNSGDSGAPPKFNFKESDAKIGPIQWPMPKRISVGHLVNIGYENTVVFLFRVTPQKMAKVLKIGLGIEWLVCKEECIPGIAEISLIRPVNEGASVWNSANEKLIAEFSKRLPRNDKMPWNLKLVQKTDDKLIISVQPQADGKEFPDLIPVDGEHVNPQSAVVEKKENEALYTFGLPAGRGDIDQFRFLVIRGEDSWESIISLSGSSLKKDAVLSFLSLLFFAFLGGIILNLMPCVLPVLSIKFLSIVRTSEVDRHRQAVLYMSGVLATFFVLGSVFLILRSVGTAIGWGFQLQSPYIILFLILLFWIMALNFLGVFEFGESIMNVAGNAKTTSSFTTGILAVFVAAPCTGPFMGTALGAAATLPTLAALGIFLSLGFGLAFPFVLVSFVPALYRLMPRPGAWMDRLKQFLAFPLLATVIWLMWVLEIQLGSDGWLVSCTLLLLIALAFWLGKSARKGQRWFAAVLGIFSIVAGFFAIPRLQKTAMEPVKTLSAASVNWVKYDRDVVDQARAKGQSVFVDFTAAWCITCQLNKKTVLETDVVQALFQSNDVLTMRADWTNQDPVITKALAEFNRNSVPVYLFYSKGAEAQILPQILTINMIESLFNKKE